VSNPGSVALQWSPALSFILHSIVPIAQILFINIVLSGDNALVIALAARRLPVEQRRQAMVWGILLAVAMRLFLTLIVSYLLLIPGLQILGALLLGWIACRLLQEEAGPAEDGGSDPSNLRTAVARIALADVVMSLDNVLAIAGVSQSNTFQLIFGLAFSIAIILACSTAILALMNRFRWIVFAGTAVLALTAAGMMSHDLAKLGLPGISHPDSTRPFLWVDWAFRLVFAVACMTSIWWWPALKAIRSTRLDVAEKISQRGNFAEVPSRSRFGSPRLEP
jgi:YjbE family integral membrane protein